MHCEVLGWPADGPTLRLDHREFGYAGKFVMSSTGKAVLHERDTASDSDRGPSKAFPGRDADAYASDVVAAVAFNEDRTNVDVLWLRYVTVRRDRRGDGLGPRLLAYVRDVAYDRGYDRLRIAVNNPYSYEALYKTGFGYADRQTGLAELVLEHPAPIDSSHDAGVERYRDGLAAFTDRDDLTDDEREFLAAKRDRGPPPCDRARAEDA